MRLALAADHAGVLLKRMIGQDLIALGHDVLDLGGDDPNTPDDYPDHAAAACEALRSGRVERAIVVCGSGVGVSVAANKVPGVRAAVCHETYSAHQGVEHDDLNVLCLGARVIGPELAREIVLAFLSAQFTGEERHRRRLEKIIAIERHFTRDR